MFEVSLSVTAEATGFADTNPVGRPINRSVEARRIDKGLKDQNGMAEIRNGILNDPLLTEGQDARTKVWNVPVWKNQKARVVGNVLESIVLVAIRPTDPEVSGLGP